MAQISHRLVCIWFTAYFHRCPLWPWPLTSKINRVHPLTIMNISAKFDEEIHNSFVSFVFTSLSPYMSIVTLTSKINRVRPLTMANMSAKFDQEAHNGLVSMVFTSLFPYMSMVTLTFDLWPPKSIGLIFSPWLTCLPSLITKYTTAKSLSCSQAYFYTCPLWPWPLTSKINRVHPLIMVNISAKSDKEICNGVVSIVFTSLFPHMSIVTLTFDLWPPKSIGFILSSWLTCLPSLTKKYATV